jgi:hypothetical protein
MTRSELEGKRHLAANSLKTFLLGLFQLSDPFPNVLEAFRTG